MNQELKRVKRDGKYGFKDEMGKIVIPCQWKSVQQFRDGIARVKDENDLYGFINERGEIVIPCQWKDVREFSDGLAAVQDVNDLYGFINKSG